VALMRKAGLDIAPGLSVKTDWDASTWTEVRWGTGPPADWGACVRAPRGTRLGAVCKRGSGSLRFACANRDPTSPPKKPRRNAAGPDPLRRVNLRLAVQDGPGGKGAWRAARRGRWGASTPAGAGLPGAAASARAADGPPSQGCGFQGI
jgi:hypothetical protein